MKLTITPGGEKQIVSWLKSCEEGYGRGYIDRWDHTYDHNDEIVRNNAPLWITYVADCAFPAIYAFRCIDDVEEAHEHAHMVLSSKVESEDLTEEEWGQLRKADVEGTCDYPMGISLAADGSLRHECDLRLFKWVRS